MSKPRYPWWGYAKSMARKYPTRKGAILDEKASAEQNAVEEAIAATKQLNNGLERMKVVDMVLFHGTHQIPGAALMIPCSERTAAQWHGDFIREIAKHFKCNGLI